ncbi:MAG: hypothetical protein WDM90_19125 [Ferruginibacter sp.]
MAVKPNAIKGYICIVINYEKENYRPIIDDCYDFDYRWLSGILDKE